MKLVTRPTDLFGALTAQASGSAGDAPSGNVSPGNGLPPAAIPRNGGLEGAFWLKTVPNLVQSNPSVKHANLAIHALIDSKRPQWTEEGSATVPGRDSYNKALNYHGQALSHVRGKPANRESLQTATLCCLFFIVFAMMNDDVNAAQAHMYNGCRMMGELQGGRSSQPLTNDIEPMLFREVQKALRFVAMQRLGSSSCSRKTRGPKADADAVAVADAQTETRLRMKVEADTHWEEQARLLASIDTATIKQEG